MINDSQKKHFVFVRELLLKAEKQKVSTVIGIPKENQEVERRLALTPEAVSLLVSSGYRVLFEAGGAGGYMINYSDSYYAESGAEIVETAKEVFQADLILKILPPTLEEVQMMRLRSTVFSFLYLHRLSTPLLELMSEKRLMRSLTNLFMMKPACHPLLLLSPKLKELPPLRWLPSC